MPVSVGDKGISGQVFEVTAALDTAIGLKSRESNTVTMALKPPASVYASTATATAYNGNTSSSDGAVYARSADLNTLRAAYEALRAHLASVGICS